MDPHSNYDENSSDDSDIEFVKLVTTCFNPLEALNTLESLEDDLENEAESSIT